ncbi:MAG: carboxymuconolactone decarboxylase family protein [Propionibacteriaceae bacterium]|nr:carboxymuconolactone decarboxylase family protein [Propionibacteriaceae bacterium]
MSDGAPRLARIRPEAMTPQQKTVYDAVLNSPRASAARTGPGEPLPGPFNAMLLSPPVGLALQNLGSALRYESQLPDLIRELIILLVAGRHDSAYEQYAHEPIAQRAGADDDTVDCLRAGEVPAGLGEPVELALRVAETLLDRELADEEYAHAVAELGEAWLFEINAVIGYYQLLARQLALFGVRPPQEMGR